MANVFSAIISASLKIGVTKDVYPETVASVALAPLASRYGSGATTGNIDGAIAKNVSATTGGVSMNLHDGTQVNPGGADPVAAARVLAMGFYNADETNSVTIGGNFITTHYGTSIPLPPGSLFIQDFKGTGKAVTASTADTITLTSAAGTPAVQVAIATRST